MFSPMFHPDTTSFADGNFCKNEVGTKLSGIWRFVHLCSLGARPPLALARVPKGLATVKGLEGFLKVFLSKLQRCCFSDMHRAFFGGEMDGLMENDGK